MKIKKTKPAAPSEPRWILFGTDFTDNARQAARAAAAIAKRFNEPVTLVHAVETPGFGATHPELLQLLEASNRKALREEAERIREAGVTVDEQLPTGRADEVLVDLAHDAPTRMMVVSSLGRREAERWLPGSVSERTAERATVPTLVVRDAAPFEAWTRGERPLRVFVAFNCTVTSEAALRWVKELQAIGPCEPVVAYVDWPPEERKRLRGTGPLPLVGNLPEVQAELELDLKARVVELLSTTEVRTRVEANWGRPDVRLANMAKEEGADIIVVGSHHYHGFERLWHTSVSRGILHSAAMSVVVVPQSTGQAQSGDHALPE